MSKLKVGDRVVLLKIPDGLLNDLPDDEQAEIRLLVGQTAEVTEIDNLGRFWIGFGYQIDDDDESRYAGHSFVVTAECLRSVD